MSNSLKNLFTNISKSLSKGDFDKLNTMYMKLNFSSLNQPYILRQFNISMLKNLLASIIMPKELDNLTKLAISMFEDNWQDADIYPIYHKLYVAYNETKDCMIETYNSSATAQGDYMLNIDHIDYLYDRIDTLHMVWEDGHSCQDKYNIDKAVSDLHALENKTLKDRTNIENWRKNEVLTSTVSYMLWMLLLILAGKLRPENIDFNAVLSFYSDMKVYDYASKLYMAEQEIDKKEFQKIKSRIYVELSDKLISILERV